MTSMTAPVTATLTLGPIALPLSERVASSVEQFIASAERRGYAVLRAESEGALTVHATKTERTIQPYTVTERRAHQLQQKQQVQRDTQEAVR